MTPVERAGWFALQKIDRAIARRVGLPADHDWTLLQDAAEELRRALNEEGEIEMVDGGMAVEVRGPGTDRMPAAARVESWSAFLERVGSEKGFEEQRQLQAAYDRACAALIGPNDEQEDGERKFKKKSAWLKLARHFNISTIVVSTSKEYLENIDPETVDEKPRIFVATAIVRAIATWGQVAEAAGACATDEEVGQRVITIADAVATAQTRATNRAVSNLIAMGEVSAEEIHRGENGSGENGRPQRKEKPPGDFIMPFGPSKRSKISTMDTEDLEGALRWVEERSAEKGKPQFADFVKAATQLLTERRNPVSQLHPDDPRRKGAAAPASGGGEGRAPGSDTTPSGEGVVVPTLEQALAYPFPFRKGTAINGRPLGELKNELLENVRAWIREQQQTNEDFHQATIAAINVVLEHRQKDQTRLELEGSGESSKTSALPSSGSQEPLSGVGAPSGGGKAEPAGKTTDAPGSRRDLYRRAEAALKGDKVPEAMREEYRRDMVNGFKTKGRPIEYWIRTLEARAGIVHSEEIGEVDFPAALSDPDDDLPF